MITEKIVTINGCIINIRQSGKGSQAIIFVHGNSSSAVSWNAQLNDAELAAAWQLIAFDLPGHGKSGKKADYSLKEMAKILTGLVEHLNLTSYLVLGLSLGTCIVAEAAPGLKSCNGFMMLSPNLVSNNFPPASFMQPLPQMAAIASPVVTEEALKDFSSLLVFDNDAVLQQYRSDFFKADPDFRASLGKTIVTADWSDELANLKNSGQPICIAFGKEEKVIKTDYLDSYTPKWRDKVFFIEHAAHFFNAEQPTAFNTLLKQFASDAFK